MTDELQPDRQILITYEVRCPHCHQFHNVTVPAYQPVPPAFAHGAEPFSPTEFKAGPSLPEVDDHDR